MKLVFPILLLFGTTLARADDFSSNFAVVMIDDRTAAKLGPFPYDRGIYAQALDCCADAGAKGVVLKFFFDQPRSATGDTALATAIGRLPVALQACLLKDQAMDTPIPLRLALRETSISTPFRGREGWIPLPQLMEQAKYLGFVDAFPNPKIVSWIPMVEEYQGRAEKSLMVCCLETATGTQADFSRPGRIYFGRKFLTVDSRNVFRARIDPPETITTLSLDSLLSRHLSAHALEGKVVIIGLDAANSPTILTEQGPMRVHRFFLQCLAATYAELNRNPEKN